MIYVTGDLHRKVDIDKLYKIAKLDTVPNIVLITDDFGGSFLSSKIITCPGNHENYDTISMLPKTEAYGGRTEKLSDTL